MVSSFLNSANRPRSRSPQLEARRREVRLLANAHSSVTGGGLLSDRVLAYLLFDLAYAQENHPDVSSRRLFSRRLKVAKNRCRAFEQAVELGLEGAGGAGKAKVESYIASS